MFGFLEGPFLVLEAIHSAFVLDEGGAIPDADFDVDGGAVEAEEVVTVRFSADASRDGGACLDHNDGTGSGRIISADITAVAVMKMSGDEEIDTAFIDDRQRRGGAANEIDGVNGIAGRRNKGVMRHDDLESITTRWAHLLADEFDLFRRDAATFPGERTRGVDAQDDDFGILVARIKNGRDKPFVPAERGKEPAKYIVEWDVVIAWDDDLGLREGIEERAGGAELAGASALGEVTADGNERGVLCV